jgi:hypothetical protein
MDFLPNSPLRLRTLSAFALKSTRAAPPNNVSHGFGFFTEFSNRHTIFGQLAIALCLLPLAWFLSTSTSCNASAFDFAALCAFPQSDPLFTPNCNCPLEAGCALRPPLTPHRITLVVIALIPTSSF